MSEYTTPSTELEAVNELLASIKESPITSISEAAEQAGDATIARQKLILACKSVQARGWSWNTDIDYPLVPDAVSGETLVPLGTLKASFKDTYAEDKGTFVIRGTRVYDRRKHTYLLARTLEADITVLLEYSDMPHAAKDLVTKMATRAFQQFVLGEQSDLRFTTADIDAAYATLENTETETADFNMLTGSEDRTTYNIGLRYSPRQI